MQDIINYVFLVVVSYLGLGIGVVISHFAKEEIKPGQKYFKVAKQVVFATIFYLFAAHLGIEKIIDIALVTIITLLSYVWDTRTHFVNTNWFYYSFFAVIMYETRASDLLIVISTLIFLFGIIAASIKMKKLLDSSLYSSLKKMLLDNSLYILLSIALLLTFKP